MSFFRAATRSTRTLSANARRYASSSAPSSSSSSKAPALFLGVGVALAGAYYYVSQEPKQEKSPLDPENFIDFKLKKVIPYNHNTSTFVFELPKNEASLLPVASCVIVKSSDPEALKDAKGKPVIRPYTPISPSDKKGELSFLVKKYDEGKASKYIHDLKVGETLAIKGPIPKFDYKINEFDEVTLIGGGSGITPLYQILDYALPDKSNKTKFTLLFANVTEKDILMKEEFEAFQKKYPDTFKVVHTLDKPETNWTGPTGYINADLLKANIAPASLGDKTKVFVCGPPGQVAALAGKKAGYKQGELDGVLKELGYTSDQVFKF